MSYGDFDLGYDDFAADFTPEFSVEVEESGIESNGHYGVASSFIPAKRRIKREEGELKAYCTSNVCNDNTRSYKSKKKAVNPYVKKVIPEAKRSMTNCPRPGCGHALVWSRTGEFI